MSRTLAWRSPLTIVLLLACTAFLGLGLRTFLFPASAAAFYGVPTDAAEALVFVKAYGARNIALSLIAFALIRFDSRPGMVALLGGAALIAALDATIMFERAGMAGAGKHLIYVAVLSTLSFATYLGGSRANSAQVAPRALT